MENMISVIMPVKNGETYLAEAIHGIKRQSMDVEIIVVDDGSTDKTAAIANELDCRVVSHSKCKGQVAAKNTGLDFASGEYVMFHDGDDVMYEEALLKMYNELKTNNDICAVMAMVQDFVSPELTAEEAKECSIKDKPYYGLFTGAVLIRKTVFDTIGKFDESLNTGEIIAWKSELEKHGMNIKKLDFISTHRRVHKNNYGKTDRKKEFQDYAKVLRAKMASK